MKFLWHQILISKTLFKEKNYSDINAVKQLIVINRIQNKGFCLHNICMCTVHIYCVYINTHTYSKYFENIYMYIFIFLYYTLYIFNKYNIFLKYIHACVCIYIYTVTVHTHILIKQNLLFWMWLIMINRLTALSATYHYCEIELFTSWHNILVISPISIKKDSKFQKIISKSFAFTFFHESPILILLFNWCSSYKPCIT